MKMYLAGPMRGIFLFNFPAFRNARESLRAHGHEVMCPAEEDEKAGFNPEFGVISEDKYEELLKRDFAMIDQCDGIVLLPGWSRSQGAQRERAYAQEKGKYVFFYDEMLRIWENDPTSHPISKPASKPKIGYNSNAKKSCENCLHINDNAFCADCKWMSKWEYGVVGGCDGCEHDSVWLKNKPPCSFCEANPSSHPSSKSTTQQANTSEDFEVQENISLVCDELKDMLIEKNKAYGNSALDPVRIFSKADSIEQIKVRLDDKLSRLMRGSNAGEDVILDLMGYLVLLRVAMMEGE